MEFGTIGPMDAVVAEVEVQPGGLMLRFPSSNASRLMIPDPVSRPFLKWPGGKQWLSPFARSLVPTGFEGRYFEPFLGAGAMFFGLLPAAAVLGDLNAELISTFLAIQVDPEAVIAELQTYQNDKGFYANVRESRPRALHKRSARMIYLNRAGFNGIYRVNSRGQFNVPFGHYANPMLCPEDRIREAAIALQGASLTVSDFGGLRPVPRAGDFVYVDPPYTTGHQNNGFIKYNARLFSWEDQSRLAAWAQKIADRGAHVLVSNADHPEIDGLYGGFQKVIVTRMSLVGGRGARRGFTTEALFSSYSLFAGCG